MTETGGVDRPQLETIICALFLCVLSPGRLYPTSDEFVEHLLMLAAGKGLIPSLRFGLDGRVPAAQFFIREWIDQGLLVRSAFDGDLLLTPHGLHAARADVLSSRNMIHRVHLERITRAVLRESIDTVLAESAVAPELGSPDSNWGLAG